MSFSDGNLLSSHLPNLGAADSQGGYDVLLPLSERVMPYSAEVYATLVESNELEEMHDVSHIQLHGLNPFRDENAKSCPGGWSLIPVHWSQIQSRGGKELSSAQKILNFEFFHSFDDQKPNQSRESGERTSDEGPAVEAKTEVEVEVEVEEEDNESVPYAFGEGCFESDIIVSTSGTVHALMLYWKVYLLSPEIDPGRTVTYSTEPKKMNWQDHWLQVVFPLPKSLNCVVGDVIKVTAAHDALRIWLKAEKIENSNGVEPEYVSGTEDFCDENHAKKAKITVVDSPTKTEIISSKLKKMESIPSSSKRRLIASQCTCGWHLLCGSERIQSINDKEKNLCWEKAISNLMSILNTRSDGPGSCCREGEGIINEKDETDRNIKLIPIMLDVSDGSILSIAAARELTRLQIIQNTENGNFNSSYSLISNLKIVSLENKIYSRMFHDRLIDANRVEEVMMIWDGLDWDDIKDYFADDCENDVRSDSNEEDVKEVNTEVNAANNYDFNVDTVIEVVMINENLNKKDYKDDDEKDEKNDIDIDIDDDNITLQEDCPQLVSLKVTPPPPSIKIRVLMSECFYYQLHALPTWQAISFLYKRTELNNFLEDNALILPGGARVMAAAIELTDLSGTYGRAGK